MKKIFKNNIKLFVGLLIGLIICSVGVYAANLTAQRVTYEPEDEDWEVSDVKNALDQLYERSTKKINGLGDTISISKYGGTRNVYTSTISLKKGTYLCSTVYGNSTAEGTTSYFGKSSQYNEVSDCDNYIEVKNYSNCQSASVSDNSHIFEICLVGKNFICTVNEEKNITIRYGYSEAKARPYALEASCTKLNIE